MAAKHAHEDYEEALQQLVLRDHLKDLPPPADSDSLGGMFGAVTVGTCAAMVAASIFMISTLTSKPLSALDMVPNVPKEWLSAAMSDSHSDREELCVGRVGATGRAYLDCSPVYHKGRRPGGKLIIDQLPTAAPTIAQEVFQYNVAVAAAASLNSGAEIHPLADNLPHIVASNKRWGVPGFESGGVNNAPGQLPIAAIAPIPSRAPENLRLIRAEGGVQMQFEPPTKEASKSAQRSISGRGRCKARSYWNGRECRLKRGRR